VGVATPKRPLPRRGIRGLEDNEMNRHMNGPPNTVANKIGPITITTTIKKTTRGTKKAVGATTGTRTTARKTRK